SNLFRSGTLENYEPEIRKAILKLTRPGMVAYDIGANIGVFSFLFASIVKSGGTVYAFEPEKNNYICLEKSLEINNIKNVFLDKRAVGKYKGKEIFDRRGGAFSGRLIGEDVKYNQTGNIEYIDTINIDTLITVENVLAPDIMKIDVEGNEILVLEGMVNTLQKYSPIILCELHTHLGESSNDVINLLIDNGYSIYGLDEIIKDNYIEPNRMELTRKRYIVGMKQIL
nr:FkbM family methyltransferase [Candidatus Dadabacteria bacterium]